MPDRSGPCLAERYHGSSQERFGERVATRCRDLLKASGQITFPLAAIGRAVTWAPSEDLEQFLVYRRRKDGIDLVRVLHDARDLERNLPEDYLRNPN